MFLGSIFVAVWTLLRFFTTSTTYDLVTQQLLAHSWLHGYTGYISLGPTNYLLKIFLLYMPVDLLPGSPRFKLIVLTILINIVTFLLLFYVLRKILAEFRVVSETAYFGAMLWLTSIAGSVFWIGYANSRNLEVAGGMFLVWRALRILRRPTKNNIIGLAVLAGLLFFADSLQLYMVALPLIVYSVLLVFYKKVSWQRVLILIGIFGFGFMASIILNIGAQHLLNFTVSKPETSGIVINVSDFAQAGVNAIKSTVRQFAGSADAGRGREIINLLFLSTGAIAFIVATVRRKIPLRFALFIGTFLVINELVYIASGAALQSDTSRYLIMLGPIIVLALSSIGFLYKQSKIPYIFVVVTIVINGFFLSQALVKNWDISFPKDSHLQSVARYLNNHSYAYVFASMDTSAPLAYYGGISQANLFPVACSNSRLVHAIAFRSTKIIETTNSELIPIILDHTEIVNAPNICRQQDITVQFGLPTSIETTNDGSAVLIYPDSQLTGLK